jgi:hypothetical protein
MAVNEQPWAYSQWPGLAEFSYEQKLTIAIAGSLLSAVWLRTAIRRWTVPRHRLAATLPILLVNAAAPLLFHRHDEPVSVAFTAFFLTWLGKCCQGSLALLDALACHGIDAWQVSMGMSMIVCSHVGLDVFSHMACLLPPTAQGTSRPSQLQEEEVWLLPASFFTICRCQGCLSPTASNCSS